MTAGVQDAKLREKMQKALDQTEEKARRCAALAAAPAAVARVAIAAADLTKVINAVKANAFDDGKLATLKASAGHAYFTCDQARTLVGLFTFGDGQQKAALLLYPR